MDREAAKGLLLDYLERHLQPQINADQIPAEVRDRWEAWKKADLVILDEYTQERPYGYVFRYGHKSCPDEAVPLVVHLMDES